MKFLRLLRLAQACLKNCGSHLYFIREFQKHDAIMLSFPCPGVETIVKNKRERERERVGLGRGMFTQINIVTKIRCVVLL